MTKEERLTRLAYINGSSTINAKLIEELKEAIEAVERNDDIDILEELADVGIMIEQWLIKNHQSVEYDIMQDYKIERTEKRLGIYEVRE